MESDSFLTVSNLKS